MSRRYWMTRPEIFLLSMTRWRVENSSLSKIQIRWLMMVWTSSWSTPTSWATDSSLWIKRRKMTALRWRRPCLLGWFGVGSRNSHWVRRDPTPSTPLPHSLALVVSRHIRTRWRVGQLFRQVQALPKIQAKPMHCYSSNFTCNKTWRVQLTLQTTLTR